MTERVAHDISYMSAVYGADKLGVRGQERDRVLALLFVLIYSSLRAYADLEAEGRRGFEFSDN